MFAKRVALVVVILVFAVTVPAHAQDRKGWGVSAGIPGCPCIILCGCAVLAGAVSIEECPE